MSAPEPQAGASARPWRTDRTDIFDAYGNKIASVSGSETQLDDAALIVQAVNSHDALVAALTVCMEAIDYAHADPEAGLPSPSWHWWKAAREALAAAQEDRTDG